MTNQEIRKLLIRLNKLICSEGVVKDSALNQLSKLLDYVAYAMYFIKVKFDEADYPDPPKSDYRERCNKIQKRFPQLGRYTRYEDFVETSKGKDYLGNAIDDLADISGEIKDVLWRWKNTSEADALWHLKNGYVWHWEFHVRGLQICLEYKKKS